MHQYQIDDAKAQLENVMKLALDGETVLITNRNQQSVQLVPVSSGRMPRKAGSARGQIHIADDFHAPLPDFEAYG